MQSIIALDLGTTGNRAIAFNQKGEPVGQAYLPFKQYFPKPGWVEHDPLEILKTTRTVLLKVMHQVGKKNAAAIGITNQRETVVLWQKSTGRPVYRAIVWQCRRTADQCKKLSRFAPAIRNKTGLPLDPYFSATKIQWILKNIPLARELLQKHDLVAGTIDTWILWNLTEDRRHATDPSNASRTLLYNIRQKRYDPDLLKLFSVPPSILPPVAPSDSLFGYTSQKIIGSRIPILGILGDQQSALFAQGGLEKSILKNTYGTGLFVMTSTQTDIPKTPALATTIAWQFQGKTHYAMEGSIFTGGSAIQWLRDGLKIIKNVSQSESLAHSLKSNEGVYFVPALTGLGAPDWDPFARGLLIGLTRGTTPAHLVRAALEAMAYQTCDIVNTMRPLLPFVPSLLRVDGGASANNFLMQFQADLLNLPVERPRILETTAFGVAGLAGMSSGLWTLEEFNRLRKIEKVFKPRLAVKERRRLLADWRRAVERAKYWIT